MDMKCSVDIKLGKQASEIKLGRKGNQNKTTLKTTPIPKVTKDEM